MSEDPIWRAALKDPRSYKRAAAVIGVAALYYVFYIISWGAIYGVNPAFVSEDSAGPELTAGLKASDARVWVPRAMIRLGFSPFADLREADVSIKPANWTGQNKDEITLIKRARLRRGNLRFADGYRAFLAGADLKEADLSGAYLFQADLRGADCTWANLPQAFLFEANLQEAKLQKADLRGADFGGADLRKADLTEARLGAADFKEAKLQGAKLNGVDLSNAEGLTRSQIDSAVLDENTKLPDYLQRPSKGK